MKPGSKKPKLLNQTGEDVIHKAPGRNVWGEISVKLW